MMLVVSLQKSLHHCRSEMCSTGCDCSRIFGIPWWMLLESDVSFQPCKIGPSTKKGSWAPSTELVAGVHRNWEDASWIASNHFANVMTITSKVVVESSSQAQDDRPC